MKCDLTFVKMCYRQHLTRCKEQQVKDRKLKIAYSINSETLKSCLNQIPRVSNFQ